MSPYFYSLERNIIDGFGTAPLGCSIIQFEIDLLKAIANEENQ